MGKNEKSESARDELKITCALIALLMPSGDGCVNKAGAREMSACLSYHCPIYSIFPLFTHKY